MDMESLKKYWWVWIIVGITGLNLLFFGMSELMTKRVYNKVMEKMQKEYSPSPYGPGIDPDKLNLDTLKKK